MSNQIVTQELAEEDYHIGDIIRITGDLRDKLNEISIEMAAGEFMMTEGAKLKARARTAFWDRVKEIYPGTSVFNLRWDRSGSTITVTGLLGNE